MTSTDRNVKIHADYNLLTQSKEFRNRICKKRKSQTLSVLQYYRQRVDRFGTLWWMMWWMTVGMVALDAKHRTSQSVKSVYPLSIANCKEKRFVDLLFYCMNHTSPCFQGLSSSSLNIYEGVCACFYILNFIPFFTLSFQGRIWETYLKIWINGKKNGKDAGSMYM